MGIIDAVKKGFVIASSKLMNVVLVFFAFNTIAGLISLPLSNPARTGNPGFIVISAVSSVLFFLVFVMLQGGALGLAKDQLKTSASGMAQFITYGKRYYVRILGLLLLYILIAVGMVLLLSLVSAGILLLGDNIATRSIVAAIVTVVGITVITFLVYPIYVVVVEETGTIAAFKKGIEVAKQNFWITLGLFVVVVIVSLLISLILGFITGAATLALPAGAGSVLTTIINAAVQSYMPIVMMVAFMSFYMSLVSAKDSREYTGEAAG
ncbi:MAG: hypothetical protein ABIH74_01005 [Candidatus Omnitrophota bacterium]